jgi:hypothetical protein
MRLSDFGFPERNNTNSLIPSRSSILLVLVAFSLSSGHCSSLLTEVVGVGAKKGMARMATPRSAWVKLVHNWAQSPHKWTSSTNMDKFDKHGQVRQTWTSSTNMDKFSSSTQQCVELSTRIDKFNKHGQVRQTWTSSTNMDKFDIYGQVQHFLVYNKQPHVARGTKSELLVERTRTARGWRDDDSFICASCNATNVIRSLKPDPLSS